MPELAAAFASLFESPEAQEELDRLGDRVVLDTFSLATSSLRHLPKWYDRLQNIANGIIGDHANYLSDPASLGLVLRPDAGPPTLTAAGQEFLSTKERCYDCPSAGEYELIKVLYFSGHTHPRHAQDMLSLRKRNLEAFLRQCRPTPSRRFVLQHSKALTIAELISGFPGAVEKYLQLDVSTLEEFIELGESGFTSLPTPDFSDGLVRLCRKVGSDYTRAPDRRRNMLLSMVLLQVRENLRNLGSYREPLSIPFPLCNLVSESDLLRVCEEFTDDIIISAEGRSILVTLPEGEEAAEEPPELLNVGLRRMVRRPRRRTGTSGGDRRRGTVRGAAESITIDVGIGRYAEDYVFKRYLEPQYDCVTRFGHTDLESHQLHDGNVPGADFLIGDPENPEKFIEVKATASVPPTSFALTRSELARARLCQDAGLPYEIYIVALPSGGTNAPSVYHWPNFAEVATTLTMNDLLAVQLPVRV